MKYTVAALALVMAVAPAAAQTTNIQANPGIITPDIPVAWQIDKTIDSFTKSPGAAASERASEVAVMIRQNKTSQAQEAVQALERVTSRANKNHTQGLQKAERILNQVQLRTPEQANIGINTAIQHIREAQNRKPGTPQKRRPENIVDRVVPGNINKGVK